MALDCSRTPDASIRLQLFSLTQQNVAPIDPAETTLADACDFQHHLCSECYRGKRSAPSNSSDEGGRDRKCTSRKSFNAYHGPKCVNTIIILERCSIAPSFTISISTSLAPILPPHPLHLRFSQSYSLHLHLQSTPCSQHSTSRVHQVCSLPSGFSTCP